MLRHSDKKLLLGAQLRDVLGMANTPKDVLAAQRLFTARAGRSFLQAALADVPKAIWPAQEASGTLVDFSGNGLDLDTVTGSPTYRAVGPYHIDYAAKCAGGVGFNRSALVSTVTNNFSLELWVMVELVTADNQGLLYQGSSASNGWGVLVGSDRRFKFLAGGVVVGPSSAAALGSTAFSHVVVTRDGGTWKYYLDGAVDTANAGTNAPNAPSGTTTRVLNSSSSCQARYAYAAIYESALSADQVAAHFAAGIP